MTREWRLDIKPAREGHVGEPSAMRVPRWAPPQSRRRSSRYRILIAVGSVAVLVGFLGPLAFTAKSPRFATPPRAPIEGVLLADASHLAGPAIALDPTGVVHVAWTEGLSSEAYVVHRDLQSGGSWSTPETLSDTTTHTSAPHLLPGTEDGLCLVWRAAAELDAGLFRRCQSDGSWSPRELIYPGLTGCMTPIVTDEGGVHVLHHMPTDSIRVDGRELNRDPHGVVFDAALVDHDGTLHALWMDDRLRYRASQDGGANWSVALDLAARGGTRVDAMGDAMGVLHVVFDGADGLTHLQRAPSGEWTEREVILAANFASNRVLFAAEGPELQVSIARDNGIESVVRTDAGWSTEGIVAARGETVTEIAATVDRDGAAHLLWLVGGEKAAIRYTKRWMNAISASSTSRC